MHLHAPARGPVTRRRGGPCHEPTSLGGMSWHWRLEDASGAAVDPADVGVEMPATDNQGDAESWLGEHWRDLLARGVATATLYDGTTKVYGPMGLAPAE